MTASTDSNALEAEAASLRWAFNKAAETYPGSVSQFLDSSKTGREQLAILMAWWGKFYAAVRDHTAGLAILAELQRLQERDEFRRLELADTDATLTEMKERYRELKEQMQAKGEQAA